MTGQVSLSQMPGRQISTILTLLVFCGSLMIAADATGQEIESNHEGSHESHRNTMGLFIGETFEGRLEDFTLGVEYERHINESFGIGLVAEYVSDDLDVWVYAMPFAYHNGPWKLYAGPGVEDTEDGSEYLTRVGAEYAFEVGGLEIAPQVNVDFVDNEEVWVIGLFIGKGF